MEGAAVHVDKFCSSLDVMPTLSNLFGLDYDSRLIMGSDILSGEDPLVIFANYSFINEEGYYNSILDQFTRWDGPYQPFHSGLRKHDGAVPGVQRGIYFFHGEVRHVHADGPGNSWNSTIMFAKSRMERLIRSSL